MRTVCAMEMLNNGQQIKRSRSLNWTQAMRELLVDCVKPLADIIDSKINNAAMIQSKNEAWEKVAFTFKSSGYSLTNKQLREQWNRLKCSARTKISDFKKLQRKTGGGTPPKEPSELNFEVSEVAALDFEDDTAEFDSDALYFTGNLENEAPNTTQKYNTEKKKVISDTPKAIRTSKRTRVVSTSGTSEELLLKRIAQVESETAKHKEILDLKKQVQKKKLEVQESKLILARLKIRAEEQKVFDYAE